MNREIHMSSLFSQSFVASDPSFALLGNYGTSVVVSEYMLRPNRDKVATADGLSRGKVDSVTLCNLFNHVLRLRGCDGGEHAF